MLVSIVIPVRNGSKTLQRCLRALRDQQTTAQIEILVLDSESTDESAEIAREEGAVVLPVAKGSFNHGATRNLGANHAKGELIYFTVQDACMADNHQLERMIRHFDDADVMAVTGIQAVATGSDTNPALWFQRYSQPISVYTKLSAGEYEKLSLKDQFRLVKEWDDVNAMYRKSSLVKVPFRHTSFAEDKLWARDALKAGMKLCFDPSLVVWHYHHAYFKYAFNVEYILHYHFYRLFNVKPGPSGFFRLVPLMVYRVWKKPSLTFLQRIYWSLHNLSRLLGIYLSNITFRFILAVFGEAALDRSYYIFCKQVPQGKTK